MKEICPICEKRISDWMSATGKTIRVNGIIYHTACLQDKTIMEVEKCKS